MTVFMEYFRAFWVGGLICVVGQLLINYTKLTPARILVSFVVLGVVLGALGVYDPLIEYAGGGASIPIIGFGNTIAKGVKKAVAEQGLMGVLTGGLTGSAGGITAAIFFGLLVALICKPK
ncbi:stage V sporulation protein AE, partial [Ruminococcaceae bacterium OttesenSCG-928-L11]|nr:stage V sporulation protein AE [Ruminococcaceae bacterium OttesenSCG-928-L11]